MPTCMTRRSDLSSSCRRCAPQDLRQERARAERLAGESAAREAGQARARSELSSVSVERNGLSALVDSLKGQLAATGASLAAQAEAAAGLARDCASAEARAREAERARSRLELDAAQAREVRAGVGLVV